MMPEIKQSWLTLSSASTELSAGHQEKILTSCYNAELSEQRLVHDTSGCGRLYPEDQGQNAYADYEDRMAWAEEDACEHRKGRISSHLTEPLQNTTETSGICKMYM